MCKSSLVSDLGVVLAHHRQAAPLGVAWGSDHAMRNLEWVIAYDED